MAKALSDMGSNIGLAGTVAGVTGVEAKVLIKSARPPFQKVGVLIGSAVAGGAIYSGFGFGFGFGLNLNLTNQPYAKHMAVFFISHLNSIYSAGIVWSLSLWMKIQIYFLEFS
jgi:hypothetical protein